jgi:hypothetical protein
MPTCYPPQLHPVPLSTRRYLAFSPPAWPREAARQGREQPAYLNTQSAAIVSAEHFGLATVPLSQFIGWVFPAFAYLIIAVAIPVGHLGRFTSLLGFLTVITSVIGGLAFLHPVTSLQNFQLPVLALWSIHDRLGNHAAETGQEVTRVGAGPLMVGHGNGESSI